MFKTFKDLCKSPLCMENAEPEQILLELNLKCGIPEAPTLRIFKKILSLIVDVYHGFKDRIEDFEVIQAPRPKHNLRMHSMSVWRLMPTAVPVSKVTIMPISAPITISDLPQLRYPSDIIFENMFKILFKTDAWDSLVFDGRTSAHVKKLRDKVKSSTHESSKVRSERSWRKHYNYAKGDLLEVLEEMLYRIEAKKKEKKA